MLRQSRTAIRLSHQPGLGVIARAVGHSIRWLRPFSWHALLCPDVDGHAVLVLHQRLGLLLASACDLPKLLLSHVVHSKSGYVGRVDALICFKGI